VGKCVSPTRARMRKRRRRFRVLVESQVGVSSGTSAVDKGKREVAGGKLRQCNGSNGGDPSGHLNGVHGEVR